MKQIFLQEDFKSRDYQQSIFLESKNKNTLVILPTGLGKTIIAFLLSVHKYNKENKKILFVAPTKPLVEQQEKLFKKLIKNSTEFEFETLTGLISPEKRKGKYTKNDFIFATPQLIENDIINNRINLDDFSLLIIDEAHRARGNYAYTFLALEFQKRNVQILALTASPGTNEVDIAELILNLKIENVQVKRSSDLDIKKYTKQTKIKYVEVELDEDTIKIQEKLKNLIQTKINDLKKDFNLSISRTPSKTQLLKLQSQTIKQISIEPSNEINYKVISKISAIIKLSHGLELLETQDINSAYIYFNSFFSKTKKQTKSILELIISIKFQEIYSLIEKLNKEGIIHPKLIELTKILEQKIKKNPKIKIIIFTQYRTTTTNIKNYIEKIQNINPTVFVGQTKKGELQFSQKKQKEVLDSFRADKYNILISTSVGEEGLDIPNVDLVIFYEPVPSAIRTIQRVGRTGRFNDGEVQILLTKNTRDVQIKYISIQKERKMYETLKNIKTKQKENLNNYMEQTNKEKIINKNIPIIFVDSRENTNLIKELYKEIKIKIKTQNLEIGDIQVTDDICIERKSKLDFVNSILDKRIFKQLIELVKNFRRPILILEGEENIFSIRNVHPNVIYTTLSIIACDLRIPIIYTSNLQSTAKQITNIAIRNQNKTNTVKQNLSKQTNSYKEEMENFISSIPKINTLTSKILLEKYNTIFNIINTNKETLMKIDKIGNKKSEFLIEFFNRKYEE